LRWFFDPLTLRSSFGLVISCTESKTHLVKAHGPCIGHPNHRSAHRSELCSIVATLQLLHSVVSHFQLTSGSISLFNDCSKALICITQPGRKFKRFLTDDYDLINESCHIIKRLQLSTSFTLSWVKGHFSGKRREPQHDLNAIAQNLAVSALTLVPQESPDISPPSSLVDLRRGNILTSQWRAVIQEAVHADLLRDTILRNASWSDDQFDMVDWEALRMYLKGLSRVSLFSYCKLLHGILNTNEQNNRFYGKPSSCPHCNSGPESFLHVVSCPHPEVKDYRRKQQEVLWKSLQKLRTPVTVLQYMKYGILSCDPLANMETMPDAHSHNSTDSGNQTSPSWVLAQEAFQQQDICLGWEHFHSGRLSRLWRAAFLQDFLSRNCRANEKQWTSGVIRALLSYSLSLWKYRCELLHSRSLEEAHRLKLSKLQHQVALAYEAYNSDPFIIRQDYRHLFSVPLDRRLNQDLDCLQCFLSTYDLAVEERKQYRKLEFVTARCFFFPKSLPSTVLLGSQSVLSSVSGTTVYAEMASIAAPLDTSSVD